MDLVGYGAGGLRATSAPSIDEFAARLGCADLTFIPISALDGDNVVDAEPERMPWYHGEPLLDHLETRVLGSDRNLIDLRFPVQLVMRPDQDFRGYAGRSRRASLRSGDEIMVLPSMPTTTVSAIRRPRRRRRSSRSRRCRSRCPLADDVDVGRGDMIVASEQRALGVERAVDAMVVWMADAPLTGRSLPRSSTRRATV